jgi:hypothetical protein
VLFVSLPLSPALLAAPKAPTASKAAMPKAAALPKAKPLTVAGVCVDEAGRPLKNISLVVAGTTMAGEKALLRARSKADGSFSLRVPDGRYAVQANRDIQYSFRLHPEDEVEGQEHDAAEGVVKKFIWKLSGLTPSAEVGDPYGDSEYLKYHGQWINVHPRFEAPAGTTLEITLVPRGPLVDGSQGKPKIFRRTFDKDQSAEDTWNVYTWTLFDVPLGLYTASARACSKARPPGP